MNQDNTPGNAPSDAARQEQRLDAFWHKALAAAPEAPIDSAKLAAARTAIFAAAQQHSHSFERPPSSPWQALRAWWAAGAQAGAKALAPPRWATGLASVTLASLVLVLWYQRMPEPAWDFDTASVAQNAAQSAAPAAAPAPAPVAEIAALPEARPEAEERFAARQAPQVPQAQLERAPSAALADAAPASRKVAPPAAMQAESAATMKAGPQAEPAAPPMPAAAPKPLPEASIAAESIALDGQSAEVQVSATNQALLDQVQQADGWAWRANAQSLFAPLDARQGLVLTQLLQPLAQEAVAAVHGNQDSQAHSPQGLLQHEGQQVLLKQAGQVHLIAHITAQPARQIDWLSPSNDWIASTPISEAAYNRIIQTLTSAPTTTTAPSQ